MKLIASMAVFKISLLLCDKSIRFAYYNYSDMIDTSEFILINLFVLQLFQSNIGDA